MAYAKIIFENQNTGYIRVAPVGFSWTTLFFGIFPALFRGDWKWAAIMFFLAVPTFFISAIVFCFIYNKLYIKDLVNNGYKVKAVEKKSLEYISQKVGINLPVLNASKSNSFALSETI